MVPLHVKQTIYFMYNSSQVQQDFIAVIAAHAQYLVNHSAQRIILEGHADERGTREYNLALGERRANSAKDYLMTYGVAGNRLSVISYGKERPVNSGSNPLAWSQNRRSVTVKAN